MVRRETDPAFINRIVNSAAVRPFVDYRGVAGDIDVSPAVGRATATGIVWLSNGEDAVAAFPQTGDRDYQAHLFFDRTCRGRKALDTGTAMLDWLKPFADMVWGAIPTTNKAAIWFAHSLGFRMDGLELYEVEGPVALVSKRLG